MAQRCLDGKLDRDLWAIRTSGACKQDVDRAVIENISLRLFFRWAVDPSPFTANEAYEIAGAVLGRGRVVDDRNLQFKRYQVLDDLLRFISKSKQGALGAHLLLRTYGAPMPSY